MGVRGLCRLISQHESNVSIRVDLSIPDADGRFGLVFDGSSLLYCLEARLRYSNPVPLHAITGGCLPQFAHVARQFVSTFVSAGIPVWVVFDGIQSRAKHATRIDRRRCALECTRLVESGVTAYCSNQQRQTDQLTQINLERLRSGDLSEAVLMEVLRDANVPISVALYEADNECVRLCNEVNALGVVGEDSDYFVFEQKGGYIPLSSIIFEDHGSVVGRLYRVRSIANVLGVPISFLPIIASLTGNDIVVKGLPELRVVHKVLHQHSSTASILEQITRAAKSFHKRNPTRTMMDFLRHFIQNSVGNPVKAKRLYSIIESQGIPKYETRESPNRNTALLRLHHSGKLCCRFAVDVHRNNFVTAPFGVGYSTSDNVQFVSNALYSLKARLCRLVMQNAQSEWCVLELGLGIEFNDIVLARSENPSSVSPQDTSWIDMCHDGFVSQKHKELLFQSLLFGRDEKNVWRSDSVFENAIRYVTASCTNAEPVAAALIKMHSMLQTGSSPDLAKLSDPPFLDTDALRLCAVFRHVLLLSEMANALLGWPLPRSKLEHCFDGAIVQRHLSLHKFV